MDDILDVLERARSYELEISAQLEHLERLHRIAARGFQSRENAQRTAEKLAKLEGMINEQIDLAADAKLAALELISVLHGEERGVIERYFILGMTWEQIADKMYMSDRRVFLLRKSALNKLEERYGVRENRREYGNRSKDTCPAGACRAYTGTACGDDRSYCRCCG